jgi:DNA-binding IscR family transcriptional regulator
LEKSVKWFYEEREERYQQWRRHIRAQLALEYMLAAETSNSPTKDLAYAHGRSPEVMAQWVKDLRKEGLLTPAVRGRAGGRITQQAADILGIEYVPEAVDPPFTIDVKLEAWTKKDLIYQLRQQIKNVEAM